MNNKGFTLIEVLVVVIIIGVLLGLTIPNYIRMQEQARRVSVKANMHCVQVAMEAYAVDHNGEFPPPESTEWWQPNRIPGMCVYFPGGDPVGENLQPIPGNFPVNPYTRKRYNSDTTDLTYATGKLTEPGQNAHFRSDDPKCPYKNYPSPSGVRGAIETQVYVDTTTKVPLEYAVVGWGRDVKQVMYDPDGANQVFFALIKN